MQILLLILAVIFFSTASVTASESGNPVLLRYRLSPGDSCAYDMSLRTGMAVQGMGQGAGLTLHYVFAMHVKDSTAPQLGIDVEIPSMQASTRGMPNTRDTTFDMVAGRDTRLRVILDRRGNLLFAWPSSDLLTAYETGSRMADGGVQNALSKIFLTYPADSVRTGTSWQATTSDTTMGKAANNSIVTRITSRLTYTGVVDTLGTRCARIAVESDSVDIRGAVEYGALLDVRGSGNLTGVYYIDIVSGMPLAGTIQTDTDLTYTSGETAAIPNGKPVVMRNTSDMVLQRKAIVR